MGLANSITSLGLIYVISDEIASSTKVPGNSVKTPLNFQLSLPLKVDTVTKRGSAYFPWSVQHSQQVEVPNCFRCRWQSTRWRQIIRWKRDLRTETHLSRCDVVLHWSVARHCIVVWKGERRRIVKFDDAILHFIFAFVMQRGYDK